MLSLLLALALQDPSPADIVPTTSLEDVVIEGWAEQGEVSLECEVRSSGRMENCRILSETPRGMGFGDAALAAASRARVRPSASSAIGARVTFNMTFVLPDDADDAPNP